MNQRVLPIDYAKQQDWIIPVCFKAYDAGISGVEVCHVAQEGCESPELVSQNHVLFLHLRPELNSERRIDDRFQVENVHVGDVAIVPAHALHWNEIQQEVAEAIVLTLEPQFLKQSTAEWRNADSVELLPTFAQADPLIYGIGVTLRNALEAGQCDRIYAESLLNALSIHLLRHYTTQPPIIQNYQGGLSSYKLKQAIAYINDYISENISLEELSQEVGMSQYYFCRLFKQSTGLSPYQYLIQQRVEWAKQLLYSSRCSIADIALQCGFTDQSSLTKQFQKYTGLTPKGYRQR